MDTATAATELVDNLGRTEAALAAGDLDQACVSMEATADLCRRLQSAGMGVPPAELAVLRDLAERCGVTLERLGRELMADSQRDDNHRRGITSYNSTLGR